jgi:hypothetical protein
MFGDPFNKGQNRGPLPLGEILENLRNAHQAGLMRGDGPIAMATIELLNHAVDSSPTHSDAARSRISWHLAGGTLAEQKERLPKDDPTQGALTDLLVEAHQSFKKLTDHPNIKEELCDHLIRPGLPEKERFATRELLEACCCKPPGKDTQVKDSMLLAEALAILEKPLRITSGEMRLDDLRVLTKKPKLWVALLDNLVDGTVRGSNHHLVIERLKENLASLREDSLIQARLASLEGAADPRSRDTYTKLLNLPQPKQPGESSDEPNIGIDTLF